MTSDMMFGEVDLENENKQLKRIIKEQQVRIYCQDAHIHRLNSFLVERGLAKDYLRWNKGDVE